MQQNLVWRRVRLSNRYGLAGIRRHERAPVAVVSDRFRDQRQNVDGFLGECRRVIAPRDVETNRDAEEEEADAGFPVRVPWLWNGEPAVDVDSADHAVASTQRQTSVDCRYEVERRKLDEQVVAEKPVDVEAARASIELDTSA